MHFDFHPPDIMALIICHTFWCKHSKGFYKWWEKKLQLYIVEVSTQLFWDFARPSDWWRPWVEIRAGSAGRYLFTERGFFTHLPPTSLQLDPINLLLDHYFSLPLAATRSAGWLAVTRSDSSGRLQRILRLVAAVLSIPYCKNATSAQGRW